MASLAGLILAKGTSNRLPNKNKLDFHGKPMFMVNLEKCLKIFDKVYVSSDDPEILGLAREVGAIPILRDETLCGDVPNIPVYQHALKHMGDVSGIIAVQSCSPNVEPNLIRLAKMVMEKGTDEVMTCHPLEHKLDYHTQNSKIYGSIWGISKELLENYPDPYHPNPKVLLVDKSIDIHYESDYNLAKELYEE